MNRGVTVGFVVSPFTASFACQFELGLLFIWYGVGLLDRFCFVMVMVYIEVDGVVG